MKTTTAEKAPKSGLAMPLTIFALLMLIAMILPTRERSLLPLGDGDLIGFLAQSAADEQLPGPLGERAENPIARTGYRVADRSAALLNPVLRSGGAARRAIPGRRPESGVAGLANDPDGTSTLDADPGDQGPTLALGPDGKPVPGVDGPSDPVNPGPNDIPNPNPGPGTPTLAINDLLPAIPEPATWLMLILGFAGIGQALRGRGRHTPLRA